MHCAHRNRCSDQDTLLSRTVYIADIFHCSGRIDFAAAMGSNQSIDLFVDRSAGITCVCQRRRLWLYIAAHIWLSPVFAALGVYNLIFFVAHIFYHTVQSCDIYCHRLADDFMRWRDMALPQYHDCAQKGCILLADILFRNGYLLSIDDSQSACPRISLEKDEKLANN